jgi:hypothetical protein
MASVRVYFEGDPKLKRGFATVLASLREKAAAAGLGWDLVAGRGRDQTFRRFKIALETHRDDIIALLVDAEGLVLSDSPWEHLASLPDAALRKPKGAKDEHAHLMVQIMESWFLADREALETYYGQGFRTNCLPQTSSLEDVPKETVLSSLSQAISGTKKSAYHKTRHAPDLLERIDPAKVRRRSKYCERLFKTIEDAIEANQQ